MNAFHAYISTTIIAVASAGGVPPFITQRTSRNGVIGLREARRSGLVACINAVGRQERPLEVRGVKSLRALSRGQATLVGNDSK